MARWPQSFRQWTPFAPLAESPGMRATVGFWPATCGLGRQPPSHQSRCHDSPINALACPFACAGHDSVLGHPCKRRDENDYRHDEGADRAVEGLLGMLEAVPKTPRPVCPAPSCSREGCYVPTCIWSTVGSRAIGDKQADVAACEAEAAEAETAEPTVYSRKWLRHQRCPPCVARAVIAGPQYKKSARRHELLRVLASRGTLRARDGNGTPCCKTRYISAKVRRWRPAGDYVHHRSSRNPRLPP